MRRIRGVAVTVVALLGALPPLVLLDAESRLWAFRVYVAVVALLAARSIVRWTDAAGSSSMATATAADAGDEPSGDPFARPFAATAWAAAHLRRFPFRRARRRTPLTGGAMVVQAATATAGATHHRLRPLVRAIAEERLQARHGLTVDDPAAETIVAPATWALLDPARPEPADRLARGIPWTDVDAVLTDLEEL